MVKRHRVRADVSGTTATLLLVRENVILTANIGDSVALIGRLYEGAWYYKILSADHTPNSSSEKERLETRGATVSAGHGARNKIIEIPGTAVSHITSTRTLGDKLATKYGIISTPEIRQHTIFHDEMFVVVATSGIW